MFLSVNVIQSSSRGQLPQKKNSKDKQAINLTVIIVYLQGRELVQSGNIDVDVTDDSSTLLLTNIQTGQSGKYSVEVMNDHGCDEVSVSVAVESVPDPPSGRPSISQGQDRISIAWCGPPYDGGCMISGFV